MVTQLVVFPPSLFPFVRLVVLPPAFSAVPLEKDFLTKGTSKASGFSRCFFGVAGRPVAGTRLLHEVTKATNKSEEGWIIQVLQA